MLIAYNTVTEDPNHAASAVKTALGIVDLMQIRRFGNQQIPIRTRCGINTGVMTSGAVGSPERLLFTVHGDEVNIAARLEQLNKPLGTSVLVSREVIDLAPTMRAQARDLGEVQLKGREELQQVFAL